MATNADFDALIVRIDTATNTLETSVDAVANGASDVEDSVILAQQAATQAQNSATTATQQAQAATDLVTQLEASVVLEEAPEDGQQYARQDGAWTVVDAGGGEGTVTSVNNIAPDIEGNVTLSASDVGAKPSSYIPTWAEVTGKPTTFAPIVGTGANQAMPGNTAIPTDTNQLTNGAGFITAANAPVQSVNGRTGAITLVASDIPALPTTKITSGLFNPDRLGSSYNSANPYVLVPDNASGAKWAPVPSQAASFITSGTFDVARLGSGTANASTYLRGDGSWSTVSVAAANNTVLLSQETAGARAINRMSDPSITYATLLTDLQSAGMYAGGTFVANLQSSTYNPGGSAVTGTVRCDVSMRVNASAVPTEFYLFVEYMGGTAAGKKWYAKRSGDSAATWTALDATA